MDKNIKDFLESGQLESYVMGSLTKEENAFVEKMINTHPQINTEYLKIQNELEILAMKNSIDPPVELKDEILTKATKSSTFQSTPKTAQFPWAWIMLSALLCSFLIYSLIDVQNKKKENEDLKLNFASLEEDCQKKDQLFASLFNVDVEKGEIVGNELLPSFEIAFLYNKEKQIVHYAASSVELPTNKCLQIWGDKEGKMIPLGIISETIAGSYNSIDFDNKMESFNITIEDRIENSFQDHPDVSKLVGSLSI